MRHRLIALRSDFGSLGELVVLVSVYGLVLVTAALWVGLGLRVVRAASGF